MNSCDIIIKIHVSLDEKKYPEYAKTTFSLIWLVDTIFVYRCFWSTFEDIDMYGRIKNVDEWHKSTDLTLYYMCMLMFPSIFIGNEQNYCFNLVTPQIVSYLVKEVIAWHRNFELYSNFGIFTSNFSRNAVPVIKPVI
jgi:hypothetical protein